MLHRDIRSTLPPRLVAEDVPTTPERHGFIPGRLVRAGIGVAGALTLLVLIGMLVDRSRGMGLQQEIEEIEERMQRQQQTRQQAQRRMQPVAPAPPDRHSAATYLAVINRQEEQSLWEAACVTAQTALTDPALSRADRATLATHAVADGLNALWATPAAPADEQVQQHAVDRVATLRGLATEYGIPVPLTNRQIAERAFQASLFLLAKLAFEDALAAAEITPTDQLQVQFYDSAIYNLGWHYATAGQNPATRQQGLRLLVGAYRIDVKFRLGNGLPWGALVQLLGPDERSWSVEPAPSPLLASRSPGRPSARQQ